MKIFSMRNHIVISAIVSFVVILIMILIYPKPDYSPKFIILPMQKQSLKLAATNVDSIGLYRYLSAGAKQLATISIEQYALEPNDEDQNNIIQLAKQQAAKLGANGLMLKLAGFKQTTGVEAGLRGYVMQFVAAKVGPNDVPMFSEIAEPSLALPQN